MNELKFRPTELASADQLVRLEKLYRRSRRKWLFITAIPALWLIGALPVFLLDYSWLPEALAGWCILVVFAIGAYVIFRFPDTDEIAHEYAQSILPGLLKKLGVENPEVHKRHNLPTKTLLDAGLYHGKYNALSREDCIHGTIGGHRFGMYETAFQITSSKSGAIGTPSTAMRTNEFYGWFIVVEIRPVQGFHFITMRRRANSGESDDWHGKTLSHWENEKQLQKIATGDTAFDEAFRLNTDHPAALMAQLDSTAREFLLFMARTARNSFAISVQRSRIFLLMGHESANLRKAPVGNFTNDLNLEMVEDVQWYVETIKGLGRIFSAR